MWADKSEYINWAVSPHLDAFTPVDIFLLYLNNDWDNFLIQWFTLFPQYQSNPFFPFGESYAGKFVPEISKKIHDENENGAALQINLAGLGIGDGFMSPPDSSVYANYMFELALVGEVERDHMIEIENKMKDYAAQGKYYDAWGVSISFSLFWCRIWF